MPFLEAHTSSLEMQQPDVELSHRPRNTLLERSQSVEAEHDPPKPSHCSVVRPSTLGRLMWCFPRPLLWAGGHKASSLENNLGYGVMETMTGITGRTNELTREKKIHERTNKRTNGWTKNELTNRRTIVNI